MDITAMECIEQKLRARFQQLAKIQRLIRAQLLAYADGKRLKGNELVGWLGEIYVKALLGGQLVDDSFEHDLETRGGWLVSIKSRKGWNQGWRRTSPIPKIEGTACPTHLAFVHLDDDYKLDRIWLHDWKEILQQRRFKKHMVRGEFRSYIFLVDEAKDKGRLVYVAKANKALQ